MVKTTREQRLRADLEALQALRSVSTIFDFEAIGEPPDRYTLVFRGKGLCQDMSARGDTKSIELHQCELRLPYSYPERPPDIRWLTPIFHPNISFSGFVNLRDIGLPWERRVALDAVCERLWDLARLAYLNEEYASNFAAKNWYQQHPDLRLPVDRRPLRDKQVPAASTNVIRYRRRGGAVETASSTEGDVLFIGEDTPVPQLPARRHVVRHRPPGDDDDILYIGDE